MEFREIGASEKVSPGEYLLHTPTNQIVMCGAFMRGVNKIKVISNGQVLVGAVEDFKKIYIERSEKTNRPVRTCGGCKSNPKE